MPREFPQRNDPKLLEALDDLWPHTFNPEQQVALSAGKCLRRHFFFHQKSI